MDTGFTMVKTVGRNPFSGLILPLRAYCVLEGYSLAGMGDPTGIAIPWANLYALGFGYIVCLNTEKPRYNPGPLKFLGSTSLEDLYGGREPHQPDLEKQAYLNIAKMVTDNLRAKVVTHRGVIVHCTGGVGRTGTVIGLVLANLGFDISKIKECLHTQGWPEGSKWQESLLTGYATSLSVKGVW